MRKTVVNAQSLLKSTGVNELGNGLSLYLSNVRNGRKRTEDSWLYENQDRNQVLNRWLPILKASNGNSEIGKSFTQFDLKQIAKFGPQGEIPPIDSEECSEVVEPLYSSSEYNDVYRLKEWFSLADEFGRVLFGAHTLRERPLGYQAVLNDMARNGKLSTNSGFPYFTRRSIVQKKEAQYANSLAAYAFPAVILFRFYFGKLRPVWMFPMATNLIESSFSLKIQRMIEASPLEWVRDYCTPWRGFTYVKSVLRKQWPRSRSIVGGDTTKMDAHMRPAQLQLVYRIVRWLFQQQYWPELERSLMHVNKIKMLWKYEKETELYTQIEGVHGLASGSSWTQLAETVLQLFMAYVYGVHGQGIGDDFYWIADMSAERICSCLGRFGLPANPTKQSVSDMHLSFLQRYFHQGFNSKESDTAAGAYYPTIRALCSLLMPERFHDPKVWSVDMFCTRNYMILENCADNPCFDEFVKFVVRGHKAMSAFAKKSASDLNRIQLEARKVPGLVPTYNQEHLDKPLSEFTSIRVAGSL